MKNEKLKISHFILLFLFISSFFSFKSGWSLEEKSYSCMVCHGDKKVEFTPSIHYAQKVWCADCHGGDPSSEEIDISMSEQAGFKGKPSRKEMVFLCGNCHADKKRMRQYGIPTDQLEYYQTSQHGEALLKRNDTKVAVCIDCHGAHQIFKSNDPQSPVFPIKLPLMCAKCHSDEKLMSQYNLPSNTLEDYSSSVHGQALLEKNNQGAPTCAGCHGNHGAAPPGVTEVENVCGQCHIKTAEYFSKSPHQLAMQKRLMSQCISCHEHHKTTFPELSMFDKVCLSCHDKTSGAYQRGQKIKSLIVEVETMIETAKKSIAQAKLRGIEVSSDENLLEGATSEMVQVVPITHTLILSDIETHTQRAKSIAGDIDLRIRNIFESLRLRKVALAIIWLFIFLVVIVIYTKKKTADREYDLKKAKGEI
jgi:predicted CXXCH cytochrome family protein